MSAILFTQDQLSSQLVPESSAETDSCAPNDITSSTFPSNEAGTDIMSSVAVPEQSQSPMDIYEELLGNKMAKLNLNESTTLVELHHDGSDSGLDITTATVSVHPGTDSIALMDGGCMQQLQRALSSNSGGYASSSGGLDDNTAATNITSNTTASSSGNGAMNMSGNSSLLSCSSDLCEPKMVAPASESSAGNIDVGNNSGGSDSINLGRHPAALSRTVLSYECCSENGSESSSVVCSSATASTSVRRSSSVKKKVALFEPNSRGSIFSTPMSRSSVRERAECNTPITTPSTARLQRVNSVKRTASLSRTSSSASASNSVATQARERIINERQFSNRTSLSSTMPTTPFRATPVPRSSKPQKPDSLPNALNRTQSISMQRLVQRTPSLSRARTPCTPSDDGRWPGNSRAMAVTGNAKRGLSVTPDLMSLKLRSTHMTASVMEVKPSSVNPYSTLPRRRKQKSVEDLTAHESRSSSITRDSRMASSVVLSSSMSARKSLVNAFGTVGSTQSSVSQSINQARSRRMQPPKTRIYHETSVQTALTSDDMEKMFAGGTPATRPIEAVDQRDCNTQTDIRDTELERLREEVRQLAQREHELSAKLQREREEKLLIQRELHINTERVMSMLELARVAGHNGGETATPTSDDGGGSGHDSLLMLESQIQMSGHELIERQQEIGQLRQLCRSLQIEMERSLAAQECLLQEKAAIEQESSELQDFLQHEKSALCDALKELESEHQNCKQQLTNREEEVKVLRDECRHLVRLNEQRRQENRLLQTKYSALENKSKEMMMQQNYSVSGASAALSGLHSRLDSLVEQLVSTYNITEHDLEDIGFQNETQTNGGSGDAMTHDCSEAQHITKSSHANSLDLCVQQQQLQQNHQQYLPPSSDGSLSPQRNQSFIAAVISAIRNATTPGNKKMPMRNGKRINANAPGTSNGNGHGSGQHIVHATNTNYNGETHNGDDSDSTEMLDSETEPCLMMDNVLEDVTMPDSHSHNMVSSCAGMISQTEIPSELINAATGDESLHNLSQAISNRQQMELQISAMNVHKVALQMNENSNSDDISCHDSVAEMPSLMEYCTAQAVVDQVIEVDSLVTKLLKVLRLIQMDNDNCIQQLIVDKNKLQENKEDMLEKLKDIEDVNIKLRDELMDATQELMLKNNDLSNTKAEMQRHRNEIDRLTQDICNLSTLCSNYKKLSPTLEVAPLQPELLMAVSPGDAVRDDSISATDSDAASILNLLKMWQNEGQLNHHKIRQYLGVLVNGAKDTHQQEYNERLRIYANQLENVLKVIESCDATLQESNALQQLRHDIEVVRRNANWAHIIGDTEVNSNEGSNDNVLVANTNAEDTADLNANKQSQLQQKLTVN